MNIKEQYKKTCRFLESLSHLETQFSYMKSRDNLEVYLRRMQELLDRLDNPEKDMKFIHITGTSGKGTTVALIHDMLQNAGYKVGSTSSPATTTTLERIKVDSLYIKPEDFIQIVNLLKPIILDMYLNSKYGKPSYFDILFAIALVYFKEQKCDYIVLEVGMGGRYDSTNIIKNPLVTAITNVQYDHTHLLGDSLVEIAYEKAGIIKRGSEFFTTETNKEVLELFKNICKKKAVVLNKIKYQSNPNQSLVRSIGNYFKLKDKHIDNAFINLKIPCRFENIHEKPFIILDGAHNVSKVKYFLKKLNKKEYKELYVIFGASHTKDVFGMLDLLSEYTKNITLTFTNSFRGKSFSLKQMKEYIVNNYLDIDVSINFDLFDALSLLEKNISSEDAILVIGSLYLAGDLRKKWYSEEYIIENRKSF